MISLTFYCLLSLISASGLLAGCSTQQQNPEITMEPNMKFRTLSPDEERVLIHKGTEAPFTGKYEKFNEPGTYVCKRCGSRLYRSDDKFDAHCGWPAFDDEIEGTVKRVPDADGIRTEIQCAACGSHLGHVFEGEGFTRKNIRHCVNSISLDFIPAESIGTTDTAIFAGGCFWGVEYYMKKIDGVISTEVGYTGGHKAHPTYQEVCAGKTGHYEAIRIVFDTRMVSFETVAKMFFETHDPTQWNHQGPDWGEQYRSAIFYRTEEQKKISMKLIGQLRTKGLEVVTELKPSAEFWIAEDYHQDYYYHKGQTPYCHGYVKRF